MKVAFIDLGIGGTLHTSTLLDMSLASKGGFGLICHGGQTDLYKVRFKVSFFCGEHHGVFYLAYGSSIYFKLAVNLRKLRNLSLLNG